MPKNGVKMPIIAKMFYEMDPSNLPNFYLFQCLLIWATSFVNHNFNNFSTFHISNMFIIQQTLHVNKFYWPQTSLITISLEQCLKTGLNQLFMG